MASTGAETAQSLIMMPPQELCKICYRYPVLEQIVFGGRACEACAVFYRATAKNRAGLICKQSRERCCESALKDISALYACKLCRLDRCETKGMQLQNVTKAERAKLTELGVTTNLRREYPISSRPPDPFMPLILAMADSYRLLEYKRRLLNVGAVCGTSETGEHHLDYPMAQALAAQELQLYREMLNDLPVVRDFSEEGKNTIWKNTAVIYHVASCAYNHIRNSKRSDRFYRYCFHPKAYLDFKTPKITEFIASMFHTAFKVNRKLWKYLINELSDQIAYVLVDIYKFAYKMLKSDPDWALLLLIIIVKHGMIPSNIGADSQLNNVTLWREIAHYNRTRDRDVAMAESNILKLLSRIERRARAFEKFDRETDFFTRSIFVKIKTEGTI